MRVDLFLCYSKKYIRDVNQQNKVDGEANSKLKKLVFMQKSIVRMCY